MIRTTDPQTGLSRETDLTETSAAEVAQIVEKATHAATALRRRTRGERAALLDLIAARVESSRRLLVDTAEGETALGGPRLETEITRVVGQFRLFAEALREGSFLEAAIDHADPADPSVPDVRRLLVSVGAVAVFGSSNFPFAFSALGGDVASALAAGAAVVVKAHSSHPLTGAASVAILKDVARDSRIGEDAVQVVYGQKGGLELVRAHGIRAVGFTGSLDAAKHLLAAIGEREDPIPFYGELSSINPLVVTSRAAAARGGDIARGLHAAVTGSAGQLCTKPGIAFVPAGSDGDRLVRELSALIGGTPPQVLLNHRIRDAFDDISAQLRRDGAGLVAAGEEPRGAGFSVAPMLLTTTAEDLDERLARECFGPSLLVARYDALAEVVAALARIPDSLTTTLHLEAADIEETVLLREAAEEASGRIVFNGYPTGVRVSWAQHHGGPWPATNAQHTSVGVTAIRRWLRPIAFQNAPAEVLPEELRDGESAVPRRVDGVLVLPR